MDIITIINNLMQYASIALAILFGLTTTVNLMVEVFKRLVPKIPTDFVVFVVSITLTVLALFVAASILHIVVMWYYAVGAVVLGIFVAYAAMFGFDKFTALWSRLSEYIKK